MFNSGNTAQHFSEQ